MLQKRNIERVGQGQGGSKRIKRRWKLELEKGKEGERPAMLWRLA